MKTNTMKTKLVSYAMVGVIALLAGQARATLIDFTAAEGYTNGFLHGQPAGGSNTWTTAWPTNVNGFTVDTNGVGYDGAVGTLTMVSNWAYYGEAVTVDDRGDTAVAKAVFRYNGVSAIPGSENNGQLMTITFLGGGNLVRGTLRRTEARTSDSGRSRMSFQIAANGTNGQAAIAFDQHYEEYTGVSSSGVGLSDWLEYTGTLTRGASRQDWKLELILKNLVTDQVCIAGRWKLRTSSLFFNDPTLVVRIDGQPDADNFIIAGSREIDSVEIDSYHQEINYDEVCDGNIDGAKGDAEEESTSGVVGNWKKTTGDLWHEWGYLGKTTFVAVGHDELGKFGSHLATDSAVNQTGRKWTPGLPRAVAVDETLEWSVNYRMVATAGLVEQPHMDLYLTTNPLTTSGTDPATKIAYSRSQVSGVSTNEYLSQLGCRISQDDYTGDGSWWDGSLAVQIQHPLNYANVGPTNTVTGWINLNDIGISTGDYEGDHLKVTYRARKTATNNVWDCSVTISNRVTAASWTFTETGVTNALLYNATTGIYPTVYQSAGFAFGTHGFEIDDLICRIAYAPSAEAPTLNWTLLSPGVMQLDWEGSATLIYQTNPLSVGLGTTWMDWPDTGNPVNVTNDPSIPATFFGLRE